MAELLLELLSEEIPARMQLPMAKTLYDAMKEKLQESGLFHTSIKTCVTPRRLVLSIEGLSLTQEDVVVEKRGPRVDAPQSALDGFLRSSGLTLEQLTKRKSDKGEFYFAVIKQSGRPTVEVISQALQEIIPTLIWPKSMRWGAGIIRWVRPLRNICCVFGSKILPFNFAGIESNNISYGHRFLSPGPFPVTTFANYKKDLHARYVVLESDERKKMISERAHELARDKDLKLVEDEGLLEEVAGLVEWPVVYMGEIDRDFMHVPEEVLVTTIRTHQRYFCLRNHEGKIAPNFLVVSNMKTNDQGKKIVTGNERVLRARLSDANFFWNLDRSKSLEGRVEGLKKITFHAKLGTVHKKTERIQGIAKFLAVWIPHANLELVERAAMLCKADLATGMVGELPELQGVMGGYYAQSSGEDKEIAQAMKEHYSPVGADDSCPQAPVSIAVALADKIDTLAGMFAIDERPTGSKDPYALRRAAVGIIRIILENKLSVPLKIVFEHALRQYPSSVLKPRDDDDKKSLIPILGKKAKKNDIVSELLDFIGDRLKALLKSEDVRHDLINAVMSDGNEDDLYRLVRRASALDKFLATDNGVNLLAAYRRAVNIVKIEENKDKTDYSGNPSERLLEMEEEKILYHNLAAVKPDIEQALKEGAFEEAMGMLSRLRNPIDAFFEKVTVNVEKPDVRKNRLKLLSQMRELLHEIANFSLIES